VGDSLLIGPFEREFAQYSTMKRGIAPDVEIQICSHKWNSGSLKVVLIPKGSLSTSMGKPAYLVSACSSDTENLLQSSET